MHKHKSGNLWKASAWGNIAVQILLPLAQVFTPAISYAAAEEKRFFPLTAWQLSVPGDEDINIRTRKYTLKAGDTVFSVARDHNISLLRLFRLNGHQRYPNGFDSLGPGDEIRVPELPLLQLPSLDLKEPDKKDQNSPGDVDVNEMKLASTASQAGRFFAARPGSQEASALARSSVSGAATASVQQWLSAAGTARIKLDIDEKFSLKNSQAEMLVPLYDNNEWLTFTQGVLHHTDGRNQSNLGVGMRHFSDGYMVGGNIFLDYDLSRSHARLGLGGEYWRDYLKLSANSYLRLTNWKDAPELEDYEARPADGWDIRAQGWLPALPQLGGKLMLEKYYGREVALFGKENRQHNPYAITAGINYTPFPLMSPNAEQRQGQSGVNDTRLGVEVNVQLGVPWHKQLAADAVSTLRSLAGSRHDLVERNHNIILDYRKKEVIRLFTHSLVTGYAGEQKSLGVSVNSKYGLERIEWNAEPLFAAGGKIVQQGSDWTVILPDFKYGTDAVNTYNITAVAVDKKSNTSKSAITQITVGQAAIDSRTSTFSPTDITLTTGSKTQQLTLNVSDRLGNPIDIEAREISMDKSSKTGGKSSTTVSDFTRSGPGIYTATITSGTIPEFFTLTPSARNMRFAPVNVTITPDNTSARVETIQVVADDALANGKSENRIKLTVVDAYNNPVAAQPVTVKIIQAKSPTDTVVTDAKGEAVVTVTSVIAGQASVIVGIKGKHQKESKLTFRADPATARVLYDDLMVTPHISVADGKTKKNVTAKVTDAHGNVVPDILVGFRANNNAQPAQTSVKSDKQGMASTTLTSKTAANTSVFAVVNKKVMQRDAIFTGHTATATVDSVETTQRSGIADGKSVVTFTAVIKDQNGNTLSGIPVDWKSNKDNSTVIFGAGQSHTDSRGIAETTITSTRAYPDVVITASTNASSKSASAFAFNADTTKGNIQQFSGDRQKITANAVDSARLSVRVEDTHGNLLQGVKVAFSNQQGAKISPANPLTDANGYAFATISTIHAGKLNIDARLDNGSQSSMSLEAEADIKSAVVSVNASSKTATVGPNSSVTLTAKVKDANNNPLDGAAVSWKADHNQLKHSVSYTNKAGEATVALTATEAVKTTVTAVLYNSNEGAANVTFAPGKAEQGQLQLSPQTITADGKNTATAVLLLKDRWGNPVSGQTIRWSSDDATIKFSATETGNGLYQAKITGSKEGTWQVKASSGTVQQDSSLTLLANQSSAQIEKVSIVGSPTAKADGTEAITLRVQVKDINGNTHLKGVAVGWDAAFGKFSSRLSHTDANGIAEIKLSSKQAGSVRVSAMLGGGTAVEADKVVTFMAGTIDAAKSSISLSPTSVIAGKYSTVVSVAARDSEGNLLSGLKNKIRLHASPDLGIVVTNFDERTKGVYQAELTGNKVGKANLTAEIDGVKVNQTANVLINVDTGSALVKGPITVNQSTLMVEQYVTYSAVLTDKHGNAHGAGIPVMWSANEGSLLEAEVSKTDDTGTARITLTRKKVGTAKVNLILPTGRTAAPDVIFTALNADEARSELVLSPATIVAGKETAVLSLMLRDKNGNPLSGQKVSAETVSGSVNVTLGSGQQNSTTPGLYTFTVTGKQAGTAKLAVKVNNSLFTHTSTLTVKGDTSSWRIPQVIASKTHVVAGDVQGVTYSATVTDNNGNKLPDVVVAWHLRGQAVGYASTSRTDSQGVAKTTVLSQSAGELQMTASLDDKNSKQADRVTVSPAAVATISTFDTDKKIIGSDGKETLTLNVKLQDQYNNGIPGKQVTIRGADKLTGFTLKPVAEIGGGEYHATATATVKGKVILSAWVDGKQIGKDISIEVGAVSPDLRFDNAQQSVVWTKNYAASQPVKGIPSGAQQMWSTSDNSIATVDNTGKVKLHKAGKVWVVVQTSGNGQYNPAQARYELKIDKAQPRLKVSNGTLINAKWGDGNLYSIAASFENPDVDKLDISYSAADTRIARVTNTGELTAVKPGMTKIRVSTPETSVFSASSVDVSYVLEKGTWKIDFSSPTQKTTDEKPFTLQSPVIAMPSGVSVNWTSSDKSVVNLLANGSIQGKVAKGRTRLTLTSQANDFYHASSGYYDVEVYTRPAVRIHSLKYTSKGVTTDSGAWTPVFTDDTMQIAWGVETGDRYSAADEVTVKVKDSDGKEYLNKVVNDPKSTQHLVLQPTEELWGKKLLVEVVATAKEKEVGLTGKVTSAPVNTYNLKPNEIWKTFILSSFLEARTIEGNDNSCQQSFAGRKHHLDVLIDSSNSRIDFNGKTLIAAMDIEFTVLSMERDSVSVPFDPLQKKYNVRTDKIFEYDYLRVYDNCWEDDWGIWQMSSKVTYAGKLYEFYGIRHGWAGNGVAGLGSKARREDYFK